MYKVYISKDNTWEYFSNYTFLINWLSKYNNYFYSTVTNKFLAHTGNNDNDTVYTGYWDADGHHVEYNERKNRILNSDGISIYNKELIDAVTHWEFNAQVNRQWYLEAKNAKEVEYYSIRSYGRIPDSAYPQFRSGPWPFVHKRARYRVYRKIKTTNEIRQTSPVEYKEFTRQSRGKNLVTEWDDPVRDWRNKGWKQQGKNKHQWEHAVKTRTKHKFGKEIEVCPVNKRIYWDIA